ncbi:MAG TPA: flagellar basal body protein [Fimbriimonadaceae bacterium]|nr:flagellar basal body protein [Fimbriimonadaceae bacterium]
MLDKLFGPHSVNLDKALDRTSLRHSVLSSNLANVNTPGYKRRDVDFAVTLEGEISRSALRSDPVRPETGSIRYDGSSVVLEKEVMSIAETELRYEALTDMVGRYFSGLKNVIREGR